MSVASHHRQVESRLAESDVRYTAGRRAVVEVLGSAEGPLGAAEIHDRLEGQVPLSSVYRTLSVLEEAGVLIPHFAQKGLTRYELAEWLRGHHHHLVCIQCGGVEDFTLPDDLEADMDRIVRHIGGLARFQADTHSLEIEGRCARCAT
ncbi:MAG: transcriptional repressor [Acidimicrobiales bacterium]|nr:transcriptional repressor [Acidimicrobiales bacterium]HLV89892.1 Fur family transcriptional regulator [Acidimicrobiia bacterium]